MSFVLAIDQGTTGTKAHRLDADGRFTPLAAFEHKQSYPQAGWVEHDPMELLAHVTAALEAGKGAAAFALDNQGETVIAWNGESGEPLGPAIVWQDARTEDFCQKLKSESAEALSLERAGLPLDPYFSASKLRWMLDHYPGARQLLAKGKLRLATSDAFFIERLTGRYLTDVTTASRTGLMNLSTCQWDEELCRLFGIPLEVLPQICSTTDDFGGAKRIAMTASLVDQQAALFGHGCRKAGDAKITFGTGAFALALTPALPKAEEAAGLARSIAWRIGKAPPVYALEGGLYNAASAVNWAKGLGLFSSYEEIDGFAGKSALERGLVFVPALSGLAAPHWDRAAAGMWLGLALETSKADMMQSLLEGIALLAAEVLDAIAKLAPFGGALSIDGGLSHNAYFCDFLSAATGREIIVPASSELTALGTAQLATIGAGLASPDGLPPTPAPKRRSRQAPLDPGLRQKFATAVERCRAWR